MASIKKPAVLIITPYFAPQSHAAVFRAYKIAKYLPDLGWDVHVLTVDKNYLYNEDPKLLANLPPSVKIHTAKYIEPTLRGLRMAFGGKDRSFQFVKKEVQTNAIAAAPSLLKNIYNFLRLKINSPDPYWTWKNSAIAKAKEIIAEHKIDVIMTSSLPFTAIEIGYQVKQKTGVSWVADFRDPMTYDRRLHSTDKKVYIKQKSIEKLAVDHANAITTLTSAHPLILADSYGVNNVQHASFIPTGLDTKLIAKENQSSTDNYLIFTGEYLTQYGEEFFAVLQKTFQNNLEIKKNWHIKIVGYKEINQSRLMPTVKKFNLSDKIEFVDHLSQEQLYKLIQNAKAAVLCTSRRYPWWTSFAKLVDYIALKKQVIAIIPNPSEARKWLQLTNLGIFLDGNVDDCSKTLADFLMRDFSTKNQCNDEHVQKFYVENQVKEFEKVFRSCLKGSPNVS